METKIAILLPEGGKSDINILLSMCNHFFIQNGL